MSNAALAVTASVCLLVALAQSWLIVATLSNPQGPIGRHFPNSRELIRSHIDYLMMAQFLFVFYGLFRLMSLAAPLWIVVPAAFGSFFNPFSFFVRSMRPSYIEAPPKPFLAMITTSCIATSFGYAAFALILAVAAVKAA